jgi:hypothetical protein
MKNTDNTGYIKPTQKEYSLSFKLQIVQEIEQGLLTKSQTKTKYSPIFFAFNKRNCCSEVLNLNCNLFVYDFCNLYLYL